VSARQLSVANPANSWSFCTTICSERASACGRMYSVRVLGASERRRGEAGARLPGASEMRASSWPPGELLW